ncbi:MAG: MerC domain-containing protein [Waterburya sp.]
MNSIRVQRLMDKTAIALSTACAIHCLLLPILIIILPILSTTFLGDESFHHLMLWLVLPTSVFAISQGCRRHKDRLVLVFGSLGLMILFGTAMFGEQVLNEDSERIATVLGAMSLVFGHYRNYSRCLRSKCDR